MLDSSVRHRMVKVAHYLGCGRGVDIGTSGTDGDARRTDGDYSSQYLGRKPYSIGRHKCEICKRLRLLYDCDNRHARIGDQRKTECFVRSVVISGFGTLEMHIGPSLLLAFVLTTFVRYHLRSCAQYLCTAVFPSLTSKVHLIPLSTA